VTEEALTASAAVAVMMVGTIFSMVHDYSLFFLIYLNNV
jgi:hypothetical protein